MLYDEFFPTFAHFFKQQEKIMSWGRCQLAIA